MLRRLLPLLITAGFSAAQTPSELLQDPGVKSAVALARQSEPQTLQEQAQICEVPAPPFQEKQRGLELKHKFEALGLEDVHIDQTGNVIGRRPGKAMRPNLVVAAHLDTVFPQGTNVHVTREGEVLTGSGIGDDCRGLAVMLGAIRALNKAQVVTPGTITFVADVGEEGLGNLRGVKSLFTETFKGQIDRFVSIDDAGLGIVHIGVGSLRYRVTFKGPGGHSYGSFGIANPINAMGRAIAKIADFQVSADPKTTFNVGRAGGGTSVNAIPSEAWMEVDLRSTSEAALKSLDAKFQGAIKQSVEEENRHATGQEQVTVSLEQIGARPAGQTARDSAIVQTALAVSRALGLPEELSAGSTDANVPMRLHIPAITVGGGGMGRGAHSSREVFDSRNSWQGSQRAVLLAIALAR